MSARAMAFALDLADEALKVGFDNAQARASSDTPALIVFEFHDQMTSEDMRWYLERWRRRVKDTPFGQAAVIVMQKGVRMSFIDATGTRMATVGEL